VLVYMSENPSLTCKEWDGELETVELVDNPAGALLSSRALLTTARGLLAPAKYKK
jgi:hypothetical protein